MKKTRIPYTFNYPLYNDAQRDAKTTPHIFLVFFGRFHLWLVVGYYDFDVKNAEQSSKRVFLGRFPSCHPVVYYGFDSLIPKNVFVVAATPRPRRTERVVFYSVCYFATIVAHQISKCNSFLKENRHFFSARKEHKNPPSLAARGINNSDYSATFTATLK